MSSTTEARVAVITGGSSGIGLHAARALRGRGLNVYELSRRAENAEPGVTHLQADVTDEAQVNAAVAEILRREGRIDILINNAGFGISGAIEFTPTQEARRQFDVNFFGMVNMNRAVLPVMRQQGGGRIINMCSLSGTIAFPTLGFYAVSKAGVMLLSETLAQEVSGQGIFVTCVEPGGFRTNFGGSSMVKPASDVPEPYAQLVATMDANMAKFGEFASGDPKLAAKKIIELAEMTAPPVRVALGDDALPTLRHALEKRLDEYEGSAALGQGTSAS